MRRFFCSFIVFASLLLSAETLPTPDLSREMSEAATAIGASNGTDLELAIVKMRTKLNEARVSDDFGAALMILDLTAGPGTEKLRAAAGRHAVVLAPHLPEAHLRHAQRLYNDGFESRYWMTALKGYLATFDQPLFLRPLCTAIKRPLLFGIAIPLFLFLITLFCRRRETLLRRYGIPVDALFTTMAVLCVLVVSASFFTSVGPLFLLIIAALLFPAATRQERWLTFIATLLLLIHYGIVTALNNLPPAAPNAINTTKAFLAFTAPGSIEITTIPYLFHGSAFSWMMRHGLIAFFFAFLFFTATLLLAFLLARHRVEFCTVCGVPLELGENARTMTDRCIVCEHIAEHQRQVRETEIRRYREQATFKRQRTTRWAFRIAWLAPGAGLIFGGRIWEGTFYLFGTGGLLSFALYWYDAAYIFSLYRPLTTTPVVFLIMGALFLYILSVTRTYLAEHHS